METLTVSEIEQISGGKLTAGQAATITVGLMSLAVTPVVIGAGCIALFAYAAMR